VSPALVITPLLLLKVRCVLLFLIIRLVLLLSNEPAAFPNPNHALNECVSTLLLLLLILVVVVVVAVVVIVVVVSAAQLADY
jgi:hypothetical protein